MLVVPEGGGGLIDLNGVAVRSSDTGFTLRRARDPAANIQGKVGEIRCVLCDVSRSNWGRDSYE